MKNAAAKKDLMTIPGIGQAIADDLLELGYRSVADLKGEDPQKMYERSCRKASMRIDRCLLYTYRCAVYYATAKRHDQEKLKWWYWKD